MASRAGRVAVATGVIGGAIAVVGGHPASAQEPQRCIDAIQAVPTGVTAEWGLGEWNDFIFGGSEGDVVTGGCVGDFGVGKLVINVLDKATGLPVDGTVDITQLLNAFQFGYEDYPPYGSPEASRLDPYCDLRWVDFDETIATDGAKDAFNTDTPRLDEDGFGGRPLRLLHWITPDASVQPVGLDAALQPHQIAFSWACDASYETLTTPAIADVGGGYELLAGRNTGRGAADGTSDFRVDGGGTVDGLEVSSFNSEPSWQQIDLYVSKRPVVEESTTTTTTTTTTTLVPAPPTTQGPAIIPPGPPTPILPETGRENGPFALVASFLLAIGAAAIGVSRRRPASR